MDVMRTISRQEYDWSVKRWESIVHDDIENPYSCGFCRAYHNSDNYLDEAEQAEYDRLEAEWSGNRGCVTCPLYKKKVCANFLEPEVKDWLYWRWDLGVSGLGRGERVALAQEMLTIIRGMEAELFGEADLARVRGETGGGE
jgi:hypothetical protein